jgi:hypothetical protein
VEHLTWSGTGPDEKGLIISALKNTGLDTSLEENTFENTSHRFESFKLLTQKKRFGEYQP